MSTPETAEAAAVAEVDWWIYHLLSGLESIALFS